MLEEGMEYTMDGDVVDSRNRIIRKLKSQVTTFRILEKAEQQLRENNPALQDAWEQYQTILTLTREA